MYSVGCILLMNILASGWNDYDIHLVKGYRLVRTNASTVVIFEEKEGFVVPPKITGLSIKGDLIFGLCEPSKNPDIPYVPGYFLLDTQESVVKIGLTKAEWLNELKKYNISKAPPLRQPSRYWNITKYVRSSIWMFLSGCVVFLILRRLSVLGRKTKWGQALCSTTNKSDDIEKS